MGTCASKKPQISDKTTNEGQTEATYQIIPSKTSKIKRSNTMANTQRNEEKRLLN